MKKAYKDHIDQCRATVYHMPPEELCVSNSPFFSSDLLLSVKYLYCRKCVTCTDIPARSETHFTDRALGTVQWGRQTHMLQNAINNKTSHPSSGQAEYSCPALAMVTVTVRSTLSVCVCQRGKASRLPPSLLLSCGLSWNISHLYFWVCTRFTGFTAIEC